VAVVLATAMDDGVSAIAGAAKPPVRAAVARMTTDEILRVERGTRCTGISRFPFP
jgi:hypothetical protein